MFNKLMAALQKSYSDLDQGLSDVVRDAYYQFEGIFKIVMPVLIAIVLVIGMIYAVIIGVQFAKAEDTDTRDKAKTRLINVIIGVVIAVVLMVVIWAIIPVIMGSNLFGA